jgi:hypothetical protein
MTTYYTLLDTSNKHNLRSIIDGLTSNEVMQVYQSNPSLLPLAEDRISSHINLIEHIRANIYLNILRTI